MFKKLIPLRGNLSRARAGAAPAGRRRRKPLRRVFERLEDRRVLSASTLLNEIDVNPPGRSDNRYMYVEIEGTPDASLNNVWFVAFQSGGVPELALNLSSYSIGSDGFAVIKSSTGGFALPPATTLIPDDAYFQQSGTAGFSQDPTSFYLFSSPNPFSTSTDYDQNNDGVFDHLPIGAAVMDNIAVSKTSDTAADTTYGGIVITEPTGGTPDAVTRFPGTIASNLASWFGGELVDTDNVASQETYDVTRPGTNMPDGAYLTPGSANYPVSVNPPSVTSGGTPVSYTVNGTPTAIDPNVQVVAGSDASLTGAQVDLTNPQTGDTLNFSSQNGITETSYSGGVLTLGGSATVAQYQTALQSVTFSSSNTVSPSTTPRVVTITADDTAASPSTSDTISDTVDVTIPPPSVTAGGSLAQYTAGANAVTVDGGIQVGSVDTSHLTGATMTISAGTLQSGDTLNFSSQNGITETSFTGGVLTLGGTASASAYQTALQSVTFNSSSTNTMNRAISVTVSDSNATPSSTGSASETVDVYAPAQVTALYVKGAAWAATFNTYLGSHSLGNSSTPTLGYALQTGANQSKDLPWVNMTVIEATFSEPVTLTQGSLVLTGSTQSGYSVPSVTGFSTIGTSTYAWTLSTSLTKNRLEISFLSTGAHPVTDSRGAGLSGNWTNGTTTFSTGSGDGLAGTASGPNSGPNSGTTSDFNFLFNVLPGDSARNGITVNPTDATDVKNKSGANTSSSSYVPYYDVIGSGVINPTDFTDVKNRSTNAQASTSFGPSPQDSSVGGLTTTGDDADLTGGFLAVQEGSTGQTGGGSAPAASNQTSGGGTTSSSSSGSSSSSTGSSSSSSSTGSLASDTDATDAAVTDFDLADLWA